MQRRTAGTPTSVCLLLRHDLARRQRQQSSKFVLFLIASKPYVAHQNSPHTDSRLHFRNEPHNRCSIVHCDMNFTTEHRLRLNLLYQVTARLSDKIMRNWVMTQFCIILLDDLAVTWWRNQATMTVNNYHNWTGAERCQEFGLVPFWYRAYSPGERLSLILMVKMETRHPVEQSFGIAFSASIIIAELWWPEVARPWNFVGNVCVFWEKQLFMVKFSKFCFESLHGDTDRRYCVEMSWIDGKSVKSCVIYLTENNFGCLSNCCYCADRVRNLPGPCSP